MRSVFLASAILGLALSSLSLADDTFLGASAQGAYRLASKDIALASERVSVVLSQHRADVDCVFVFRNEGPAQTALIGFPEGPPPGREQLGDTRLNSFRAWVHGRALAVKARPASPPLPSCDQPSPGLLNPDPYGPKAAPVSRWHTFKVRFARGQTCTVRNRYWVRPTQQDSMGGVGFCYVLSTARTWKGGKIGRADIRVRLKELQKGVSDFGPGLALVEPKGYHLTRNTIIWNLPGLVPKGDIHIAYEPRLRHCRALLARTKDPAEQGNLKFLIGQELLSHDPALARSAFECALRLAAADSRRAACELWIGRCYEREGQASNALRHYERAVQLDPQGESGQRASSARSAIEQRRAEQEQ
jgi:tetratricopeptide (TPR) repeat protein